MQSYQFDINEGTSTATLTVKADSEQSALQQAQNLLKESGQIGSPRQVSDEDTEQTQA